MVFSASTDACVLKSQDLGKTFSKQTCQCKLGNSATEAEFVVITLSNNLWTAKNKQL